MCSAGLLSPFAYTWDTLEFVAMFTLRCRWNAIFYTRGECEGAVSELRPGAFHNTSIGNLPKVRVDKELDSLVELYSAFKGDVTSRLKTQKDGKGEAVTTEDKSIFLIAPNEDGPVRVAQPVQGARAQGRRDINALPKAGGRHREEAAALHREKLQVRQVGCENLHLRPLLQPEKRGPTSARISCLNNTFLTTTDNFEEVVGPVLKDTISLLR